MKALTRRVGLVVAVASLAWPFAAVWLSAHQVIRSETESTTSALCLLGAAFGPFSYWGQSRDELGVTLRRAVPILAVIFVLVVRGYSDRMFAFWIIKATPASAWQQMAFDASAVLANHEPPEREFSMAARDLPRSFGRLGRADQFGRANALNLEAGVRGICLLYGGGRRRWGLAVGSKEYFDYIFGNPSSNFSKFKLTPVATNAVFFIGSDR